MKIIILLFFMIPLAQADLKSEEKAIDDFYLKEYVKPENYLPTDSKYYYPLQPLFSAKLIKDTKLLKYFLISHNFDKWLYKYKNDRAFSIFWETKFSGKSLTVDDKQKVYSAMANFILDDKDLPAQKKALKNLVESDIYFQTVLKEISKLTFK